MIGLKKLLIKLSCPYRVGDIYVTTVDNDPHSKWNWTNWEQITNDAYLKIVTNNAGMCDGTSEEHKIPLSSWPSHQHVQYVTANSGSCPRKDWKSDGAYSYGYYQCPSGSTGGDQPYYPYYYSICLWKRIA